MADISNALRIKFGLDYKPTQAEVDRWVSLTEQLIKSGVERERAGAQAAASVFRGIGSRLYASQADTIVALLAAAKNK